MIASCLECVFGGSRDQADNEAVYNKQLNGDNQRAPPWPTPREEKEIMFLLPRKLGSGDQITITGTLNSNRRRLAISLITGNNSPDYSNIACQFEAQFPDGSSDENRVLVKMIQNGVTKVFDGDQQNSATDVFPEENFTFTFLISIRRHDIPPLVDIYIDQSQIIGELQLTHHLSDIKFLSVSGDIERVEKLDFEFGNQ